MGTNVTKNYGESGDVFVVGGELKIASGGKISAAGTQATNIVDATTNHTVNATFSDAEVKGHLDALGTKINSILAALEGVGIVASS